MKDTKVYSLKCDWIGGILLETRGLDNDCYLARHGFNKSKQVLRMHNLCFHISLRHWWGWLTYTSLLEYPNGVEKNMFKFEIIDDHFSNWISMVFSTNQMIVNGISIKSSYSICKPISNWVAEKHIKKKAFMDILRSREFYIQVS